MLAARRSGRRQIGGLAAIAAALALSAAATPATAATYDNFAAANEFGPFEPGQFQGGLELGDNVGATKEPSEPNHAGFAGGASVWWYWDPTVSGNYFLSTCLPTGTHPDVARFDTLLAVYTGTALNDLVEVASNDNGNGNAVGRDCSNGLSHLTFAAQVGTRYHLAVDSKGAGDDLHLYLEKLPNDKRKPTVKLTSKPAKVIKTGARKVGVQFKFRGADDLTPSRSLKFKCKLDSKPFRSCKSPYSKRVGRGSHKLKLRATDAAGKTSKVLTYSWSVKRR